MMQCYSLKGCLFNSQENQPVFVTRVQIIRQLQPTPSSWRQDAPNTHCLHPLHQQQGDDHHQDAREDAHALRLRVLRSCASRLRAQCCASMAGAICLSWCRGNCNHRRTWPCRALTGLLLLPALHPVSLINLGLINYAPSAFISLWITINNVQYYHTSSKSLW